MHIKIFMTVILSVSFSIIILSLVLYAYFERAVLENIFESERNNLYQAGVSIKLMQDLSRNVTRQMYSDYALSELLYVPHNDPVEVYRALSGLEKYYNLINYIHSIYIYNPKANAFYLTSSATTSMIQEERTFFDGEILGYLHRPEYINSLIPLPRIINEPGGKRDEGIEKGVYTFIFNQFGKKSGATSSIIINISEAWLRAIIDSLDIDPENKALIIDRQDRVISGAADKKILSRAGLYGYVEEAVQGGGRSGYRVVRKEGGDVFLVFSRIEAFDWLLIKEVPYAKLMGHIMEFRRNMLFISVFLLALGVIISFLLSKRLTQPFDALFEELKSQERRRKDDVSILKRYRLNQLLAPTALLDRPYLRQMVGELFPDYRSGDFLTLVLFDIDRYHAFRAAYSPYERNLLKLGILTAAERVLGARFRTVGIDPGENVAAVIVALKGKDEQAYAELKRGLAGDIQGRVEKTLGLSISVTVGRATDKPEEVSGLYEQGLAAFPRKFIIGFQAVIDAALDEPGPAGPSAYPLEEVERLTQAMHQGNAEGITAAYDGILHSAGTYGHAKMKIVIDDLAYKIAKIIHTLKRGRKLDFPFDVDGFLSTIATFETLGEVNECFRSVFADFMEAVKKRNKDKKSSLIRMITGVIENEYGNSGLSVAMLADRFGFSAAYLGRIYHEATGKSLPDHVNQFRIEKAAELLRKRDHSISEIMTLIGFTNKTHFYGMFKKFNGLTPNEFRRQLYLAGEGAAPFVH